VAAVLLLFWIVHRSKDQPTSVLVALGLMAGGAIGNLIDRVLYGKVIDFILWRWYEHRWPVFNIADVCLTCSVALILLSGTFENRKKKRAAAGGAVKAAGA
jgi:signal peptidase II